jgi:hypothetical protein
MLTEDEFQRACKAHRTIQTLKQDAPNTFASPPTNEDIFSDDIKLSNDVGLQVVSGRAAYLEAFIVARQAIMSPLVPFEVTGLVQCDFTSTVSGVRVQWRVPMRIGGGGGGATVQLSGLSTYRINRRGKLSSHALSDLRVNQRRLPSSTLGAWLGLLQARGSGTSPGIALMALMDTLKAERRQGQRGSATAASVGSGSAEEEEEVGTVPASAKAADLGVPLPGTEAWPAYERRHPVLMDLLKGFQVLLDGDPPLSSYADGVELAAEAGEVLVSGLEQYRQLLTTLRNLHRTLGASPLIKHSFTFDFVDSPQGGDDEEVRVAWRYELEGLGSGRSVVALEATSAFRLALRHHERGEDDGYQITRHTLNDLRLNGRQALPARLLDQLRRVQTDSPELVRLVSSTLLAVSGSGFAPGMGASNAAANARRGEGSSGSGVVAAAADAPSSAFSSGYVRLLGKLHAQLPRLLSEPLELNEIAISTVEVRGLLREPLLQGRPALGTTLNGLRRLASLMLAEGAVSIPSDGLEWRLEVEPSLGILIRWSLSFELGRAEIGRIAPRVAVPGKVEGEVLLGLADADARVGEVWVRRIALNEQTLLPKRLSEWLERVTSGGDLIDFVRSVLGGGD